MCTVCGKRGHNAADCWDKLDADQAKLDVAKANRDKKKADMAKLQREINAVAYLSTRLTLSLRK